MGQNCLVAEREIPNFATKLNFRIMTDYEYIIKQAKKLYYTQWSDEELRKCVDMLPVLEREELVSLCHCKWIKKVMKAQNYLFSYARTKIQ